MEAHPDGMPELIKLKRFYEIEVGAEMAEIRFRNQIRVARDDNDRQLGVNLLGFHKECDAGLPFHSDVSDHQVHDLVRQNVERLFCARRRGHAAVFLPEKILEC